MTAPVNSAKARLRLEVRERLSAMTGEQRQSASLLICTRLRQQAFWKSAGSTLFFAPMADEPNIWPLLEESLLAKKSIGLPRFSHATGIYAAARIKNPDEDLHPGLLGIREPTHECAQVPLNEFHLVLVPGVAFDLTGHRLGRGKGYYDRLLADVRAIKCGIAYDEQLVDVVPTESLDVRLDFVLTPTRCIAPGRSPKPNG